MNKKQLEQLNKEIAKNPDFIFYDYDNECEQILFNFIKEYKNSNSDKTEKPADKPNTEPEPYHLTEEEKDKLKDIPF